MRNSRTLAVFALFGAALLHCSSDEFSTGDSGSDTGAEASLDDAARDVAVTDTGPIEGGPTDGGPIDSAPPLKCDPKKPFGTPTKVLRNGLDVVVDVYGSFRIDATETHAWVQQGNQVRQYDLANGALTYVSSVSDLPAEQGFGVSANGLELVAAHGGGLTRHTRANLTSNWGPGTPIPLPFGLPDGAAFQQFYYPYLSGTPALYLGRFVYYSAAPSEWDVIRIAGDAGTTLSELHAGNFAFTTEPVLADELTMYISRWGGGPVPHLARTTRASTAAPWSPPADVSLGSLTVATKDGSKPYAVTPDDCSLYLGYAQSVDGSFALDGPFVLYVARRPL
jgi:hypothetical protein